MKILFVSNTYKLFSSLNTGASNRSTMFIKALSNIADVDVIAFSGEETSNIEHCRVIYSNYVEPAKMIKSKGRLGKFAELFGTSIYDIYPYSEEKSKIVDTFIKDGGYDYIACRYIYEAAECGLLKYSSNLIVDLDDNPAKFYLALMNLDKMTFRNRIYHKLYAYKIERIVKKTIDKIFCVFYSNPFEAPSSKSIFLHNVAIQEENSLPISEATPKNILMVGTLNYFPNAEGVTHFVDVILPMIIKEEPYAEFYLAGKSQCIELENYLSTKNHVHILGFVEDLARTYCDCRVAIVPMYSGSGTSIKTIEAMTMHRPIVATPSGARGYSEKLISGEDYILANNDVEFAQGIINLIRDIAKGNMMADNAYNKYLKYWSQEKFIDIVKNSIDRKDD